VSAQDIASQTAKARPMLLLAVTHVVIDKAPASGAGVLDWLPAVTAAIAAFSACLSLAAVRQARKIWEHSLLPVLSPAIYRDGTVVKLSVVNTSKTVAAGAGWAILWGDRRSDAHLPHRVVAPDAVADPIAVMDFRENIDDLEASPRAARDRLVSRQAWRPPRLGHASGPHPPAGQGRSSDDPGEAAVPPS
jgi:hypothetical protein